MSESVPVVSITVVLYNSAQCLQEGLLSVREDVRSGFAELLVVDNASPDESAEIVEREFPEGRLIKSDSNRKFAGGCNLSWPFVRGRYWLLLNPDAVVPPNGLRELVKWMEQHPQLGAASPKLVDKQGRDQCAGRRFQSISRSLLEMLRLHLLLPQRTRANLFLGSYWNGSDHTNVDWVPGAALIARREAVEDAGLLSEEVLFYGEDSEWCWRIRNAGWRIGVCGQVSFEHEEGQSTSRTWDEDDRSRRMWRGIYDACRLMRGSLYTKLLTAVNTAAFAIEAYDPRVAADDRTGSRKLLDTHIALLKGDRAQS
jgi:GT2 family glycosyltransferase